MAQYTAGQRWISDSEPELGLGVISAVEARRITVEFPRHGETRLYALENAPLTRIAFKAGDEIRDRAGRRYTIHDSRNNQGVLIYRVRSTDAGRQDAILPESELADTIALDQPLRRLLAGQADNPHWYQLRRRTLDVLNFIERSPLLGLCSARADLLPHQLYIAHEVSRRHAPRVLLADEVGLGKTIEAGLILQQQLFTGHAARVLLLVPDALVHQWLVEMLRRFNLRFSIFDEERCAAASGDGETDSADNPFFTEQLVLCSSGFFLQYPLRQRQALAAEWDLLVVDEAHHLKVPADGEDASPAAAAYRDIAAFSRAVKGLILLTATPDQMGPQGQFGLLRLLDPDRFHDYAAFQREQAAFARVADLIQELEALDLEQDHQAARDLVPALRELLRDNGLDPLLAQLADASLSGPRRREIRARLIAAILDRHGTGRVLFRNSRKTVAGFPARVLHPAPLPCPEAYGEHRHLAQPESALKGSAWLGTDPRVAWLETLLKDLRPDKVLVICARRASAIALEEHLRLRRGQRSAVFHEAMSIVERDRAAAWFAQAGGAQVLVCSEIGSEGRNFQFSHHLVLFDLCRNPDLLEQRIGRLDRIGQQRAVDIHVPYLEATAQQVLFHWYQDGLNAFTRINPAAFRVYREQANSLDAALAHPLTARQEGLVREARELSDLHEAEFARGRDRLIELNSFEPETAGALLGEIEALEQSTSPGDWLRQVFDSFGVENEDEGGGLWGVTPGEHMLIPGFPGLPEEGLQLTWQRRVALHREDVRFVSWRHPLVSDAIDLILQGHYGKTALGVIRHKHLLPGTVLLESLYRIDLSAPRELQLARFFPCTTIRTLVDSQQRDLGDEIDADDLAGRLEQVDRARLLPHVAERRPIIGTMHELSEQLAARALPAIVRDNTSAMLTTLGDELKRLVALKQVNPNVRDAEIEFLQSQIRGLHQAMENPTLQLEGLLLVFVV